MPTNCLTDAACKSAKPKDKAFKLFDGHGLHLVVTPTGSKLWRVSYRAAGKPQTASFGPYPLLSLADARAKRDDLRRALASGAPVKPADKKARAVLSLRQASEKYWQGRQDVSADYRTNAEAAIERHILPKLGGRPIGELTRVDVLDVLATMDAAGLSEYVRKTRGWLMQVFDWAVQHEHATINPCKLIDPRKAFSKKVVESFAAISLAEVPAFMQRLDLEASIQSALACRLLALTWTRTQELRMMEWTEIEGDLWRIPAAKMKRRREHLVPLSAQALEIVELMRKRSRGGVYVFPNDRRLDRPMSENAILYLIGRMGYGGRMTGHGWRSVGSTWANEHGHDKDAIERQLAHAPDDKVRSTYNRAEYLQQRRAMLQAWGDWVMPVRAKLMGGGV
jgi:integrase